MGWSRWFSRLPDIRTIARQYLDRQKYEILAEPFRTAHGEVDFVVRDQRTLVLVKVRARGGPYGDETRKDRHDAETIEAIARACLEEFAALQPSRVRYAMIRLDWYGDAAKPVLRYFPDVVPLTVNADHLLEAAS